MTYIVTPIRTPIVVNRPLYLSWDQSVPVQHPLMHGGGYVIASDHSVPDSVSLEDFRRFVEHAKRVATY